MKVSLALISTILTIFLKAASAAPSAVVEDFAFEAPTPITPIPVDAVTQAAVDDSTQLEKRSTVLSRAAILFPAYIYPSSWTSPPAWQPLYTAVSSNPRVMFHIVINPSSGPGGSSPDSEYEIAIKTLRQYTNVVLLGYVHTSWGARSSDAVYADILTYAGWRSQGYSMDGIFFDEAPTKATQTLYNYMANITCYAKEEIVSNIYGNQAMIYFNPGAVPDIRYYTLANFIAIFEDTYSTYLTENSTFAPGTSLPMSRSNFMIHSMNAGWTQSQMSSFISSLANGDGLGSVFLTSSTDASNPYGSFSADWTTFVAGVSALSG